MKIFFTNFSLNHPQLFTHTLFSSHHTFNSDRILFITQEADQFRQQHCSLSSKHPWSKPLFKIFVLPFLLYSQNITQLTLFSAFKLATDWYVPNWLYYILNRSVGEEICPHWPLISRVDAFSLIRPNPSSLGSGRMYLLGHCTCHFAGSQLAGELLCGYSSAGARAPSAAPIKCRAGSCWRVIITIYSLSVFQGNAQSVLQCEGGVDDLSTRPL